MATKESVNRSKSITRLFYKQWDRLKDCGAWRAVLLFAEAAGYHLPIVGSAFNFSMMRGVGYGRD
jgi:hypothetical protein